MIIMMCIIMSIMMIVVRCPLKRVVPDAQRGIRVVGVAPTSMFGN